MKDFLQPFGAFHAFGSMLIRNFITGTPHHDRRMIASGVNQIDNIFFGIGIKKTIVAIFYFRLCPFVKTFGQEHKSHFITQFELLQ